MAALAVLLAGCSSGPSAQEWASTVCGALAPWRSTIADLNQRAADQMAQATTAEQTRQNLVALVTDARDATEQARAAVAGAGVPDVDGGAGVAGAFTAALADMRDAYGAAGAELLGLPAADETAYYDGVVAVMQRLRTRYEQAGAALGTLDSPELKDAFQRLPECQ
jgi:hypothetical protein